jgi:hypothetical protein
MILPSASQRRGTYGLPFIIRIIGSSSYSDRYLPFLEFPHQLKRPGEWFGGFERFFMEFTSFSYPFVDC